MVKVFSGMVAASRSICTAVVHHRRRSALNLATEVEIPTLVHGIVDLIGQGTRPLPNLQVLKIFRKVHAVTFYFLPFTFHQRFSGKERGPD